jgi:hypothetical protein
MRYLKAIVWSTAVVVLLTAAQYGSVHLLTRRPASWLFEASLDVAPPLLFAGDIAQSLFSRASQAPLHEQLPALAFGLFVNLALYGTLALAAAWLFFPPPSTLSEAKHTR